MSNPPSTCLALPATHTASCSSQQAQCLPPAHDHGPRRIQCCAHTCRNMTWVAGNGLGHMCNLVVSSLASMHAIPRLDRSTRSTRQLGGLQRRYDPDCQPTGQYYRQGVQPAGTYPGVFCTQNALKPLTSAVAWRGLPIHHFRYWAPNHTLALVSMVPNHMLEAVGWWRPL